MRNPNKTCKCGAAPIPGQAMCKACHAENMRRFRQEVGHKKSYLRGIDEAAEELQRRGMADAAEIVRQLQRAA